MCTLTVFGAGIIAIERVVVDTGWAGAAPAVADTGFTDGIIAMDKRLSVSCADSRSLKIVKRASRRSGSGADTIHAALILVLHVDARVLFLLKRRTDH